MQTTELPQPDAPDTLYVFDLHAWVYRFWSTMGPRSHHGFVDFVGKLLREQRPAYVAACTDLPFPTWRHDLFPKKANGTGYKAQREPPNPTLLERLRWCRELLQDVFGLPVYGARGYEADDVIATLVRTAQADGLRCVVMALDKDLMQLVDDTCVMWDGKTRVWGVPEVTDKFALSPSQVRDYLAIVGDTADNVPGVKGMGPKAAHELLQAFGDIDAALQALGDKAHPFWKQRPRIAGMLSDRVFELTLSRRLVSLAYDAPLKYSREDMQRR